MIKEAVTDSPVIEPIRNRWSARSFSEQAITETDMNTIMEAARWAASAGNEQPWQYYYAFRSTDGFDKLWNSLLPGNQPWTKKAAVLIASVARNTISATDKKNGLAHHDVGMANAQLMLQASAMGIYSHPMAGFDKHILQTVLGLTESQDAICMIALGHLDDADKLEEPFKTRELAPRVRKPLADFATKL